jgi:hypothetical protein
MAMEPAAQKETVATHLARDHPIPAGKNKALIPG